MTFSQKIKGVSKIKFILKVDGFFELSEKELEGETEESIANFIKEAEKSTIHTLLSKVECKDKAQFNVIIEIEK